MGNILDAIQQLRDSGDNEVNEKFGIFLDFESDVKPDPENAFCLKLEEKVKNSEAVLDNLKNYGTGGKKAIFEATANTNADVQEATWAKMVPLISSLLDCKTMSDELNQLVPEILGQMWTGVGDSRPRHSNTALDIFKDHMFMMLQLGKILDIDMRFDAMKMMATSISNDISYVKRQFALRQKSRTASVEEKYSSAINIQNLEALSMFYISGTPALNNIIAIITKFFKDADTKDEPLELIVSFCKICIKILGSDIRSNFQKFGTIGMVQRIMVATTLLYDHLSVNGVFVRDSPINIKNVVEILEEEAGIKRTRTKSKGSAVGFANPGGSTDRASYQELSAQAKNLLNFLKYSNKHLRDPTTPKNVKEMFYHI